jgi:hypothetical protein
MGTRKVRALGKCETNALLNLLYIPAAGSAPSQEPIGQFKVAFTSQGKNPVSLWKLHLRHLARLSRVT